MRNINRGMWKRSKGVVAGRKESTTDRFITEAGNVS